MNLPNPKPVNSEPLESSDYPTSRSKIWGSIFSSKEINLDEQTKHEDTMKSLLDPLLNLTSPNPQKNMNNPQNPSNAPDTTGSATAKILNINIDVVQLISFIFAGITLLIGLVAISIPVSINLYVKLEDKIDSGFQEIRSLINSNNSDFNRRIDSTNNRIDQAYPAPAIKPT